MRIKRPEVQKQLFTGVPSARNEQSSKRRRANRDAGRGPYWRRDQSLSTVGQEGHIGKKIGLAGEVFTIRSKLSGPGDLRGSRRRQQSGVTSAEDATALET